MSGNSMKNTQVMDRINNCNDILENKYIDDNFCNICPLSIKRFFDIQEVESVIHDFIPKLTYRVKGFYFVPLKTSYAKILYLLKDNDYQQVNSVSKSLISFRIIKTVKADIYELYLYNEQRSSIIKHSYATVTNTEKSQWLKDLTERNDECIVECKYNTLFKKWEPVKEGSAVDTVIDVKD